MKKILFTFFVMVILAGCSSSPKVTKETKTCSLPMDPITMEVSYNATDDKIETAVIKISADYASLGIKEAELTDEQKSDALLQLLDVKEGTGISIKTETKDNTLSATIDIDLKEGDTSTLEKLGFSSEGDYLLSETVKAAEESGATCK